MITIQTRQEGEFHQVHLNMAEVQVERFLKMLVVNGKPQKVKLELKGGKHGKGTPVTLYGAETDDFKWDYIKGIEYKHMLYVGDPCPMCNVGIIQYEPGEPMTREYPGSPSEVYCDNVDNCTHEHNPRDIKYNVYGDPATRL